MKDKGTKIPFEAIATLRATVHAKAADENEMLAREVKPRMFATREEREPYRLAIEQVKAERNREAAWANVAANEILAAAGFKTRMPRGLRRRG